MRQFVSFVTIVTIMMALLAGCSPQASDPAAEQQTTSSAPANSEQPPDVVDQLPEADDAAGRSATRQPIASDGQAPQADGPTADGGTDQTQPDPQMHAQVLAWLEQVASDASVERMAGSDALDQAGERAIPSVVAALREGTLVQQRGAATYLIGRVSPRDEGAAVVLIESLSVEDDALRHSALQAVEKMSDAQLVLAIDDLVKLAENAREQDAYRSRAIRAIAKLGTGGADATDQLIRLAESDEAGDVWRASFFAIAKVAPPEQSEAFFRTQLATARSADKRRLAAKRLAGLTTRAESLQQLVKAFGDPDQSVRLQAVDSLVEIGKPAIPALVEASSAPDVQTRRYAVLAIGKLGLLARDAAGDLKARLEDPDRQVRELAQAALDALE